jgi:hypothetical protein
VKHRKEMKKLLLILTLALSINCQAQKTYNIIGFKNEYTYPGADEGTFYPIPFKIFITDSLFYSDGLKYKYTITKRVDSSYFKMTDGIKDYIVNINRIISPTKQDKKLKRTAYITVEVDNTRETYYY